MCWSIVMRPTVTFSCLLIACYLTKIFGELLKYQAFCPKELVEYPIVEDRLQAYLQTMEPFPSIFELFPINKSHTKWILEDECYKTHADPGCYWRVVEKLRQIVEVRPEIATRDYYINFLYSKYYRFAKNIENYKGSALTICIIACMELEKTEHYEFNCPDPCDFQTSCDRKSCHRTGFFSTQFKCDCPLGTIWDDPSHQCLSYELDTLRKGSNKKIKVRLMRTDCTKSYGCNEAGTHFCGIDLGLQKVFGPNGTTKCTCKSGFGGPLCDQTTNRCDQGQTALSTGIGRSIPAGNEACNTIFPDNLCKVIKLSGQSKFQTGYECQCGHEYWEHDDELDYPNCHKRRSRCESILCAFGQCISSPDSGTSVCNCDPGFTGKHCTEWTGVWIEWTPWDKCRPACGPVRFSVRMRECVSLRINMSYRHECIGPEIEYHKCAERQCLQTTGDFFSTFIAVRQYYITGIPVIATLIAVIAVSIWIFMCWGLCARLFKAVIYASIRHIRRF